jgi:hypothetical protein
MGNWTSREKIMDTLSNIKIKSVHIFKNNLPLKELNAALKKSRKLVLVGFDILQVPKYKITFELI